MLLLLLLLLLLLQYLARHLRPRISHTRTVLVTCAATAVMCAFALCLSPLNIISSVFLTSSYYLPTQLLLLVRQSSSNLVVCLSATINRTLHPRALCMPLDMATRSFLLLSATFTLAYAHYNLIYPHPYNPIDCNRPDCSGPCPPVWPGQSRKPVATWKRGDWVQIQWNRNNHEGGFYKRSLVPVKFMHNGYYHKKTSFEWGCWAQGRYMCGKKRSCGTDNRGFAYRNWMQVPTVFPDGDYVFAMTWFGGLHWQRKKAHFSDYYTCSFVRIRGGVKKKYWKPRFVPGTSHRNVPKGKCASTSLFLHECKGQECKNNPVYISRPGVFRGKRQPPALSWAQLSKIAGWSRGRPKWGNKREMMRIKREAKKEIVKDAQDAKEGRWKRKHNKKRKTWRRGKWLCGTGRIPPKPQGTWGKRGHKMWWQKRQQWWDHYNYCNACKDC